MTNKKILFVNPLSEFKNPIMPLGLASIAAYLKNKEKDIDIQIIDAWAENLNFENLKIMASRTGADIIGIYMLSPRYDQAKKTNPRDFIKNLDELPFPNRDLFPLKKYISPPPYGRKNPYFIMITGRGCPFHCAYCCKNVFNDNYRARSPKNVC